MKLSPFAAMALAAVIVGCSTNSPSSAPVAGNRPAAKNTDPVDTKVGQAETSTSADNATTGTAPATSGTAEGTTGVAQSGTTGVTPDPNAGKPPVVGTPNPNSGTPPVSKTPPDSPVVLTSDWTPSKVTPVELGKNANNALLNNPGLLGNSTFAAHWDKGKGICTTQVRIANPKKFYITYPVLEGKPLFRRHAIIADGQKMGLRTEKGIRPLTAGDPELTVPKNELLDEWALKFERLMFAPLVNGSGGIADYFAALSEPGNGYTVRVDERVIDVGGKKMPQIRLLAKRDASSPKGKSVVEMIFHGQRYFLMHTRIEDHRVGDKKPTLVEMSASWNGPHKDFPPNDFKLVGMK